KRVEGGDASKQHFFQKSNLHNMNKNSRLNLDLIMIGTSMTLDFWNSNFFGSEFVIQKPLSSPPPKPPYQNLQAVASGFPSYERQYDNAIRKDR
ncbi:hypothetical protein VIGAN_04207800, partial [Vigna angularis var. angularis]